MFRVKTYLVVVHIAGWLLFMAFPLLFLNGGQQGGEGFKLLLSPYYWLFCATYIFLFYINGYFFIPRLFIKRRYVQYAFVVIVLYAGIYYLMPYDNLLRHNERGPNNTAMRQPAPPMQTINPGEHAPPPPFDEGPGGHRPPPADDGMHKAPAHLPPSYGEGPPQFGPAPGGRHVFFDTTSLFLFMMIMALSTAIKTIRQWQLTEHRATQAEADKASAELSFLKAQINPHFLFNTLNNIYTLAVMKDDNAPDSIMKLSNIMRYVTDDANADFVALQSEVDCINDYIELQRLRLGKKTTIDFGVSGNIEPKSIAPLILITFVENVFKYGVSKHEESAIVIKISTTKDEIAFFCENRIFQDVNENNRTGIGLKNTRKRLEHLYPGRYLLTINNQNNLYTVNLTLQT
ncbi:histidine kinase [Mucilaginibacter sp.]|uniref:histidine kinase n=1 Tax=Mucilaginibacter sp. TaxID=1882438 RepID=UPI0025D84CDF|nr:histidine kinase [Mucilaginibacter sp.]